MENRDAKVNSRSARGEIFCNPGTLAAAGGDRYKAVMFEKASWAIAIVAIIFAAAVGLGYIPPV